MTSGTSLFLKALASIFLLYVLSCVFTFVRNVVAARKTGLPVILVPINQDAPPWVVFSVPYRFQIKARLPTWLWNRISITIYGWEYHDRVKPFEELAKPQGNDKSFVMAGLGAIELWTRDPEVANEVLRRPHDFEQAELTSTILEVFGPNVLSTNGSVWGRHRKVVASVINERISKATWDESLRQTEGMIDEIMQSAGESGYAETNQLPDMLKKITIHVLSGAGMGTKKAWDDANDERPAPGYKRTYIEDTKIVMGAMAGAILLPILLPAWCLTNYPSFLPGHTFLKELRQSMQDFPRHTQTMLDQERERLSQEAGESKNNILSQLVQASSNEKKDAALSDGDLRGNLFVFTAAGFETTANTLTFAFAMLARYPQWQEWLFEEIDAILPPAGSDDPVEYAAVFPKAHRIMAFLLEVLRQFPPLVHVMKQTAHAQTVETTRGRFWLPEKTTIFIHIAGLHRDPAVWRGINATSDCPIDDEDEHTFRPTRWINPQGSSTVLYQPPKGSFIPWSAGPRVCPGQKMAQVEFTAIFITLLRKYRVEAALKEGETRAVIEKRLDDQIKDSMSVVTLQMNGVYDVPADAANGLRLKLVKRQTNVS
jgi:cytochrome P450